MDLSGRALFHLAKVQLLLCGVLSPLCAQIVLPRNHGLIELTGSVSALYDSNVFANADAQSDFLVTSHAELKYLRKAAYSLMVQMGWDTGRFAEFDEQDFFDPSMRVDINTRWGARDASLGIKSIGVSSADILLGTRTEYRSESAEFTMNGPLTGHLDFSLHLSHGRDRFDTVELEDLRTSRLGFSFSRPITPILDGVLGINLSWDQAGSNERSFDQSFTVGVSRQIFPKVSGQANVGIMIRDNHDQASNYQSFTTHIDLTWRPTDRLSVILKSDRDFSTIGTGESISTWSSTLSVALNLGTKWTLSSGVVLTNYEFIESEELKDRNVTANIDIRRIINSHLSVSFGGTLGQNTSTRSSMSEFSRNTLTFGVTGTW